MKPRLQEQINAKLQEVLKLLRDEAPVSSSDTPEAIDSQELISKTQAAKAHLSALMPSIHD